MQYVPEDWVYTYFRYDDKQSVMVVMNTSKEQKTISLDRFTERTSGFRNAVSVTDGSSRSLTGSWTVPATTILVLELKK